MDLGLFQPGKNPSWKGMLKRMRERIKRLTPGILIKIYQAARYHGITALLYVFRCLPIDRSLVVFCNVWGFGDNCKYVAEELSKRLQAEERAGKTNKAKLVFITNHPAQVPEQLGIRALKTNSLHALLCLARAAVWVDNNRKEGYIRKRRGQFYIQLWHGGIALKKIEGDCIEELGESYIRRAKKDSAMTDLFISNSVFCTQMYRRAFWAKCEIAEYGSPRNDRFMVKQYPCSTDSSRQQRIAIYAPTYRSGGTSYTAFEPGKLKEALAERFGGSWRILVRLHPLVAASEQFAGLAGAEDVSHAPDLYELLYKADVLLTDYSNTMFEFAMTDKPVFLFAGDVKEYQAERGMYFDYEEMPFPIAENAEQLYQNILGYRREEYINSLRQFYQKNGLQESGKAAVLVADRIEQIIYSNSKAPV